MRPLHEPTLAAVARQPGNRRTLVKGALAASSTVLGLEAVLAEPGNGRPGRGRAKDVEVLNYALTLEHLEYAFYRDGLDEFSERDFAAAGFAAADYGRLVELREHEEAHVKALTDVIRRRGGTPVRAACYDFGDAYDAVAKFLATAQLLENTGVAAYDGAIATLRAPDLRLVAATIATVEARHAAYLNLVNGDNPFPAAFDEPMSAALILAAVGGFVAPCGD